MSLFFSLVRFRCLFSSPGFGFGNIAFHVSFHFLGSFSRHILLLNQALWAESWSLVGGTYWWDVFLTHWQAHEVGKCLWFLFPFFPSLSKKLRRLLIIFRFDCSGGVFFSSPQLHYTVIHYTIILGCRCFSLPVRSEKDLMVWARPPLPPYFLFPLDDALIGDISNFLFLSLLSCLGIFVGKVRNKKGWWE